jgi:hypothetical protein
VSVLFIDIHWTAQYQKEVRIGPLRRNPLASIESDNLMIPALVIEDILEDTRAVSFRVLKNQC